MLAQVKLKFPALAKLKKKRMGGAPEPDVEESARARRYVLGGTGTRLILGWLFKFGC